DMNRAIFALHDLDDESTRHAVNRIIALLPREPWSEVVSRLRRETALQDSQIDALKAFFQLRGDPKQVLASFSALISKFATSHPDAHRLASRTITHLHRLLKALENFLVP